MDEEGLAKIRRAGRIGRRALEEGLNLIREGVTLLEVAERVEAGIVDAGALPGFPVNISRNEQAAHFTPRHNDGDLAFARGDLVKLDVGVHVGGYLADNDVPDRHYFRRRLADGRRTHHLSLAAPDSDHARETLRFRDRLRAEPELARRYE
ncbi:MAG: M24 family metallopeptidase, partial [Thermoplasmata archaeon]|nr:M24 family metallopeptidase [Thermoplasmata archaeon]